MNIFSTNSFLQTFGQVYLPGRSLTIEVFELAGQFWRLPTQNGKPIAGAPFIDFFEPLGSAVSPVHLDTPSARYLLRASQGIVSCSEWLEQQPNQSFDPSPTIWWHQFDHWDAFTQYARRKESRLFSDSRRRQRKLENEVGTLQYHLHDPRPEVLETCFRWKSKQLQRQDLPNPFANSIHLQFFEKLVEHQIVSVSSLSAGERLVAVDLGMVDQGRFYLWVTSYDPAYSQYAPGRLLLHFLLEESFKQQHTEFDFLWGGEDYKWNYATHVRLIGDLGTRPFPRQVKRLVKNTLRPFPNLTRSVKRIRNTLLSWTAG